MPKILRDYQTEIVNYALNPAITHPALYVDKRLGKCLSTVRICGIYNCNKNLIVGPQSVLSSWIGELGDSLTILIGTKIQRLQLLESTTKKWIFINKEGFRGLPKIKNIAWDALVIDESTSLKDPRIKFSKFFTVNFRDVKHRFILSGKPKINSDLDYIQQLIFLDYEILKCKTYWEFRAKYCYETYCGNYALTIRGKKFLNKQLAKYCYFINRKELGLDNTKKYEKYIIPMSDKMKQTYKKLADKFILGDFRGKEIKRTKFTLPQHIWLLQLCGGFMADKFEFNLKLQKLKELLNNNFSGQQVVIFCKFINEIKMLQKELENCEIIYGKIHPVERMRIIDDFQGGEIQHLVAQSGCIQHGVDLAKCNNIIYYSPAMGESRNQTEDRVVRVGKTDEIAIVDLLIENSVDIDLYEGMIKDESDYQIQQRIIRGIQKWEQK